MNIITIPIAIKENSFLNNSALFTLFLFDKNNKIECYVIY